MSDTPPLPEVPAHVDELVEADQPCMHCGYNLRGLSVRGRCPECGSEVANSLQGDYLRAADKEWLALLRKGTSVKLFNIVLGFLVGLTGGAVGVATASATGTSFLPPGVVVLMSTVAAGLGLWATFLITSQEPRISLGEQRVTLRRVIRSSSVVYMIGSLIGNLGAVANFAPFDKILSTLGGIGYIVASLGELVYYRRFARRVPDLKLAKSTGRLMWCLVVFFCLAIAGGLVFLMLVPAGSAPAAGSGVGVTVTAGTSTSSATSTGVPQGALLFLGCSVPLLMLFMLFWYVRLLGKYKKAFTEAINWTSPPIADDAALLDSERS